MADDRELSRWNWRPLGVAVAGVIQLSAGVYLATVSRPLGTWLIRLGNSDIRFAVRTGLVGRFSWEDYLTEKLVCIPFVGIPIGFERWLSGSTVTEFMKWSARRVARTVCLVLTRSFAVVCFAQALRRAKDAALEQFHETFEAKIGGIFASEFADIRNSIEELFLLDASNAEDLISDVFDEVTDRVDDDESFLGRIGNSSVDCLPPMVVEMCFQLMSKKTSPSFGNQTAIDSAIFATVLAAAVVKSCAFAQTFMRSMQEDLTSCLQQRQAAERRLIPRQADTEAVDEFVMTFQRRVKRCITRKISEQLRQGLVQASAQSWIPSVFAEITDLLDFW